MFKNILTAFVGRFAEKNHEAGTEAIDKDDVYRRLENISVDNLDKLMSLVMREQDNLEDENVRYQISEAFVSGVYPKYKFSEFGRLFLEDSDFIEYYKQFMDPENWHSLDRKYTLKEMLKHVAGLKGDLVECGVYKGASAWLMCNEFTTADKTVHLFDSFEGLSRPSEQDGDYWHQGALHSPESVLNDGLKQFNNYKVYKGWIPEVFDDYSANDVCFLHIDVDLYEPTLHALKYFYPNIVRQGIILMDDFGFTSCPGAKLAADNFFDDKPESIISLPTGQGLVIKS